MIVGVFKADIPSSRREGKRALEEGERKRFRSSRRNFYWQHRSVRRTETFSIAFELSQRSDRHQRAGAAACQAALPSESFRVRHLVSSFLLRWRKKFVLTWNHIVGLARRVGLVVVESEIVDPRAVFEREVLLGSIVIQGCSETSSINQLLRFLLVTHTHTRIHEHTLEAFIFPAMINEIATKTPIFSHHFRCQRTSLSTQNNASSLHIR